MALSTDALRGLVDDDAGHALALAVEQLGADPPTERAAELWWIRGLAERELGRVGEAHESQQRAHALAQATGRAELAARVGISLAYHVAAAGQPADALALLDELEPQLAPADRPVLANQRGVLHYRLGQLEAALAAWEQARQLAEAAGDVRQQVQVLSNLGATHSQRGDHVRARRCLEAAVALADRTGPSVHGAHAHANLAYAAALEGDLPTALEEFAAAEDRFRSVGAVEMVPRVLSDHAVALAEANLMSDAEELIEQALKLARDNASDLHLAEYLLTAAEIDLARGQPAEARETAADAVARFSRQGRATWRDAAANVGLRAEAELATEDPAVAERLVAHARNLRASGWRADALSAELLAALLHASAGRQEPAQALLASMGAEAARARALDRILLARVLAVLAAGRGDRRAARRAVSSGLRIAATSQAALGALEARAHAAHHGAALIEDGARLALADQRPRELLQRIEAMRTMVWHTPLVRPPDDDAMAAALSELRQLGAVAADPDAAPHERQEAERARLHVERRIRDLSRRSRGTGGRGRAAVAMTTRRAVAQAIGDLSELGDRQLVAYGNLDGRLLAVSVERGRCRLHDLGPVGDLAEHIEACSFALHRLNRIGLSEASRAAAEAVLLDASGTLASRLLPATIARSDRPLVVVPTGILHGVAWRALDQLRGRAVTVSPSLSGWSVAARGAAAHSAARHAGGSIGRRSRPVGLAAGPGLRFADAEVADVAAGYEHATMLTGAAATAERCLALVDAAELVHLACHGSFRSDNPLFSTLVLADGPLTVYDLERTAMPEIVVLSACSVGTSTAINGGTLLGLASALGAFGACDVVAPLFPVNDERLVAVMRRLHEGIATGLSPAAALAEAATDDAGGLDPVAAAFVVIGS